NHVSAFGFCSGGMANEAFVSDAKLRTNAVFGTPETCAPTEIEGLSGAANQVRSRTRGQANFSQAASSAASAGVARMMISSDVACHRTMANVPGLSRRRLTDRDRRSGAQPAYGGGRPDTLPPGAGVWKRIRKLAAGLGLTLYSVVKISQDALARSPALVRVWCGREETARSSFHFEIVWFFSSSFRHRVVHCVVWVLAHRGRVDASFAKRWLQQPWRMPSCGRGSA